MKSCIRLTLALVALALSLAATTASANRLSAVEQTFRITWSELTFAFDTGERTACPVTLSGTFHSRTIRKVAHTLIGLVTTASVNSASCTRGGVTVLAGTLPWHLTYESFSGTLPEITEFAFAIIGASFRMRGSSFECLMRSTTTEPALFTAQRTGLAITLLSPQAVLIDGGGFCEIFGIDMSLAGAGRVATGPIGRPLNVSLI